MHLESSPGRALKDRRLHVAEIFIAGVLLAAMIAVAIWANSTSPESEEIGMIQCVAS